MIKYLFIDMDNTIAENKTCDDIEFYPGLYLNKRPIQIVIDAIKVLYPDSYYVIISQVDDCNGRYEKHLWLDDHFPITYDRLFIPSNVNKKDVMRSYLLESSIRSEEVLLIDDKKSILQECKQLGIDVKYPQQIICDYESLISRKVGN